MNPFVTQYRKEFAEAFESIPVEQIEAIGECLFEAFKKNATVFLAGNGGSAALASHFACDLEKTCAGKKPRDVRHRFRAHSLVDNVATMTAWANDEGYEHVFSEPIYAYGNPEDVLLVITASGNSPNILQALEAAKSKGLTTIGWLGFGGGKAKSMCDHLLHVPSNDYGVVEGAHAVYVHLLTRWLTEKVVGHAQLQSKHEKFSANSEQARSA